MAFTKRVERSIAEERVDDGRVPAESERFEVNGRAVRIAQVDERDDRLARMRNVRGARSCVNIVFDGIRTDR